MASLVTQSEITVFTGDFKNLFDTFKRQIVVHKEPKKIVTNLSTTLYAGYRPQNQSKTEYVPQTGIFDAMITYKDDAESEKWNDVKLNYIEGDARIKLENPGFQFIEGGGKTEAIEFDGMRFNLTSSPAVKNFFGFKLYVYHLEKTK